MDADNLRLCMSFGFSWKSLMRPRQKLPRAILTCAVVLAFVFRVSAQDLEPRAYSPSPVGATFLLLGYDRSTGDVGTDASSPISNVHAHINIPILGLGHTFGLLGRQALVTAALPYAWGEVTGQVGEQQGRITRSGLADLRGKLSINLYGSPARRPAEFARANTRSLIIATSLTVSVPTGQYNPAKLINLGTNRWAFKPEVGISYPVKNLNFDLYGGVVLFRQNSQFFPGTNTRSQDPLETLQAHISYTVRPHLWVALDGTWYAGGSTHLNFGPALNRLNNTRAGATISLPLARNQSMKFTYAAGTSARAGANFDSLIVFWQVVWF
jgi:Putative MetA-pathway of phenol degradation